MYVLAAVVILGGVSALLAPFRSEWWNALLVVQVGCGLGCSLLFARASWAEGRRDRAIRGIDTALEKISRIVTEARDKVSAAVATDDGHLARLAEDVRAEIGKIPGIVRTALEPVGGKLSPSVLAPPVSAPPAGQAGGNVPPREQTLAGLHTLIADAEKILRDLESEQYDRRHAGNPASLWYCLSATAVACGAGVVLTLAWFGAIPDGVFASRITEYLPPNTFRGFAPAIAPWDLSLTQYTKQTEWTQWEWWLGLGKFLFAILMSVCMWTFVGLGRVGVVLNPYLAWACRKDDEAMSGYYLLVPAPLLLLLMVWVFGFVLLWL